MNSKYCLIPTQVKVVKKSLSFHVKWHSVIKLLTFLVVNFMGLSGVTFKMDGPYQAVRLVLFCLFLHMQIVAKINLAVRIYAFVETASISK